MKIRSASICSHWTPYNGLGMKVVWAFARHVNLFMPSLQSWDGEFKLNQMRFGQVCLGKNIVKVVVT